MPQTTRSVRPPLTDEEVDDAFERIARPRRRPLGLADSRIRAEPRPPLPPGRSCANLCE